MTNPSPDFTFDVYPGLDAELEAAFERNVIMGTAKAGDIAPAGLAAAVQNTLQQTPNVLGNSEALEWAAEGLTAALEKWKKYEPEIGGSIPTLQDIILEYPEYQKSFEQLFEAKTALTASGLTTPEGLNIGETMNLVVVPYGHFAMALKDARFMNSILKLREIQGISTADEFMNDNIQQALNNDTPFYRSPYAGTLLGNNNVPYDRWIGAKTYLSQHLTVEGKWGVALMQTSDQAGLDSLVKGLSGERTPNSLTQDGSSDVIVANQKVDAMGIFEWLALTLQEDPR